MYDQTDESLRKRISRIRGNGSGKCASTKTLDKNKKTLWYKLCSDVGIQTKHLS